MSAQGDDGRARERFELAYRAHGRVVLGYALRRAASREDALDVVSQTFVVAWRRRADLPPGDQDVRPWLIGIARHCLADSARSIARSSRLGVRLAATRDLDQVPDPATAAATEVDLRAALAELSPTDRELLTLVTWDQLTPTEAATALGIAPGTARVRLHRARTRLRTLLAPTTQEADR